MSESLKSKEQQLGLGRHLMIIVTVDNRLQQEPKSQRLRYDIMSSWNLIYDRTTENLYGKIGITFISIMTIIIKGIPNNYKIMNIWFPYRGDHLSVELNCHASSSNTTDVKNSLWFWGHFLLLFST